MSVDAQVPGSGPSRPGAPGREVRWQDRRVPVLPGRPFVVGRDESADLQILGPKVSRRHVVIQPVEQGWQVVDQSSNGSFVNGRRIGHLAITGPVTVSLGAPTNAPTITIGATLPVDSTPADAEFEFRRPAPTGWPLPAPPRRAGSRPCTSWRLIDCGSVAQPTTTLSSMICLYHATTRSCRRPRRRVAGWRTW